MPLITFPNGTLSDAPTQITQYYNLLTGVMTDQPVTIANVLKGKQLSTYSHALTYTGTIALDPTTGSFQTVATLNSVGNATINAASVPVDPQLLVIEVTNDSTSGKTITFGTGFTAKGTLVGTTSTVTCVTFMSDGTSFVELARSSAALANNWPVGYGTHSGRPAASQAGILYYETDTGKFFRDNGSSYNELDLDASAVTTGTFALALLSGITTSQLSGSAGLTAAQIASVNPSALTGSGTVPLAALTDFVASGGSHARGLVPDPGSSAGATKFLREDKTWAIPPGTGAGSVTSVDMSVPAPFSISGNPITGAGTLAVAWTGGQTADQVLATPDGSTGAVALRVLAAGHIPNLDAAKITSGALALARGGTGLDSSGVTDGQILVGQTSDHTFGLATISGGSGITVTNSGHGINISGSGSGAGGTALTQIYNTILGAGVSSVDITSIAGTYTHLQLRIGNARGSAATTSVYILMRFNADTGSNYNYSYALIAGGQSYGYSEPDTSMHVAIMCASTAPTNAATSATIDINGYAGGGRKSLLSLCTANVSDSGGSGYPYGFWGTADWHNTAAITQITLLLTSGNFGSGTQITLYGLA